MEDERRGCIFRTRVELPAIRWALGDAGVAGEYREVSEDACVGGGHEWVIGSNGAAE